MWSVFFCCILLFLSVVYWLTFANTNHHDYYERKTRFTHPRCISYRISTLCRETFVSSSAAWTDFFILHTDVAGTSCVWPMLVAGMQMRSMQLSVVLCIKYVKRCKPFVDVNWKPTHRTNYFFSVTPSNLLWQSEINISHFMLSDGLDLQSLLYEQHPLRVSYSLIIFQKKGFIYLIKRNRRCK